MNSLKNKLSSLINVSRRDSSVFTSLNPTHISVSNLVDNSSIINFFESKSNSLKINLKVNTSSFKKELTSFTDYSTFKKCLDKYQVYVPLTKLKRLEESFNKTNKDDAIESAVNFLENIKVKLMSLHRKSLEIQKDKGSWNLYLTRFFLKGITPYKKQIINAPLIMYQVELEVKSDYILLKKTNDFNELNEKIIVFLQRDINKHKKSISEFHSFNDISSIKNQISDIIEKTIEIKNENNLSFFHQTSKEIEKKYNNLVIEDGVCLGIFDPSGGKLKDDLEKIIENDEAKNIFDKPLLNSIDEIKLQQLTHKPFYQIGKLDLYQQYAVRASITDNTIIHGPPGTGKSEVITNIIANILMNNKNVMVVSEKVAALEVLAKRLKDLNIFMLMLYDIKDKNIFYESIIKFTDYLGNGWLYNRVQKYDTHKVETFFRENFEIIDNLKNEFKRLQDFENYKINDYSFNDFSLMLNEFGGNSFFKKIINSKLMSKYNELMNVNGLNPKIFFEKIDNFMKYLYDYKLSDEKSFNVFNNKISLIKKFYFDYGFDVDDKKIIDDIIYESKHLYNYLNSKKEYIDELEKNPFRFYSDAHIFKECKNQSLGLIYDDFFKDLSKNLNLLRKFTITLSKAKKSHKKFIFDTFKKTGTIVEKKPFSKLFYWKRFSKNDKKLLSNLTTIDNLNLDFYLDFDFVISNQNLFNPLGVMYFFDKDTFDKKYYDYIRNKFYIFDYDIVNYQNEFNLNLNSWETLNKIIYFKKEFEANYSDLVLDNLFQEKIDTLEKIDWDLFVKALLVVIRDNVLNKLSSLSSNEKELVKNAIRVANLKRRPSIYNYLESHGNVLKYIFPIWVARPEMVSIFMPLTKNFFEYGIYDEASQMFLERAYPLLYRSRINIVAGDDKQLKPSNFFASRDDDDDDFDMDDLDTQESLLDRAKSSSWNELMLQNHYRSESRELIEFSSNYIYDKKLNYASKNGNQNLVSLEVINVNGKFTDRRNVKEANTVLELLEKNVNKYETILIVTFNSSQSEYINNLLIRSSNISQKVIDKYEAQKIEIVNLENVQGNEADLVIMSVAYGKKDDGTNKVKSTFGPLIQDGGKNRLNVAITRAKKKMIVVKSLSASDIKSSNNENLTVFKNFIAYLDNKSTSSDTKPLEKITSSNFSKFQLSVFNHFQNLIKDYKLTVAANYDVGNKKIDIVIINPKSNAVILGMVLENWSSIDSQLKRQEVIDSQKFLEARGYKIFRIFEYEWNYNQDLVSKKITGIVQEEFLKQLYVK